MKRAEKNLQKLSRTSIPMNFVKRTEGQWEHDQWLNFCESLNQKGYTPIDFDSVGLLLEKKKELYFSRKERG